MNTNPQPANHSAPIKMSGWRIFGRALKGALIGFFAVPVIVFVLVLILNAFNKVCGTPGDSGGCEMGLFSAVIASAIPGAAIGFIVNLIRAVRRRMAE
jgi:hypothetical protein